MKTNTHSISTLTHGHYHVHVPAGEGPWPLLVGFHGYGELAEHHINQLLELPEASKWMICAVQALHPFYPRQSKIGASWMTSFEREIAIEDNINYVRKVVEEVQKNYKTSPTLVYLGFSQGAAMAYRAALNSASACRGIIIIGGDVPPDIAEDPFDPIPFLGIIRGKQDTWYSNDKCSNDIALLKRKELSLVTRLVETGHMWSPEHAAAVEELLLLMRQTE